MAESPEQVRLRPSPLRTWVRRLLRVFAASLAVYGLFLVLGFVPVNLSYRIPPADDCVRIFIRSNEIHTDLVLPVACSDPEIDWRHCFPPEHFEADVRDTRFVAVGWGNRAFYIETPRWSDLKLSKAAGALFWPSETVLHVEYLFDAGPSEYFHELRLTRAQYRQLVLFVESSIGARDEQGAAQPATAITYGTTDRFYAAAGRYHLFNTCNQWTGRGLSRAGAPVGIWTPLKPHVLGWLPENSDEPEVSERAASSGL